MTRISIITFLFLLFAYSAFAQLNIQAGGNSYLIDFDNTVLGVNAGVFQGTGFANTPANGQLDADAWATTGLSDGAKNFGVENMVGDHARLSSNIPVTSGGIYSFDVGGNWALGVQPTGSDWTPGTITLNVMNSGTMTISDLELAYTLYVRNDQPRGNSFNFSYSLDNGATYQSVASLDYTSDAALTGTTWQANPKNVTLTGLGLAAGARLYLRWSGNDAGGSGGRDEFALDNIGITTMGTQVPCNEPVAQPMNLSFGTLTATSIQGGFLPVANTDKYLVLASTTNNLTDLPQDQAFYTAGAMLGNAQVVQYSASTTFNATGLSNNTTYYFFIFSSNDNCAGGPDYLTASPLIGSATTLMPTNSGYYANVGNERCAELKTILHNIIDNHTVVSYSSLWTHYQTTDARINDSGTQTILWDMYTDNPAGFEVEFTFVTDQCGNYSMEGDCYNREHSFPRSWWGGSTSVPQYTDIFHVVPTDGWINGLRGSNPFGEVIDGMASTITNNGCQSGPSAITIPGYSGAVFEPSDDYKGDFARGYFYMATRYEDGIASWENNNTGGNAMLEGTTWPAFEPWAIEMLLAWHNLDPVDQKEIDRNEAIFDIQGNRNPYIDHPEYAGLVWGSCAALEVPLKVQLGGPYSSTNSLMNNDLVTNNYLPLAEPYSALGFTYVNAPSGELIENPATVLAVMGNNAIVDWVFVELRDENNSAMVVATRSALVQRDGDIVDMDGMSPLLFEGVAEGNYHIAIRHRNHLGAMTLAPLPLLNGGSLIDFSDPNLAMYGTNARKTINGIMTLWPGDASADQLIDSFDRSETWNNRNQFGYLTADVDLDGACDSSDRSVVWNNRNKVEQLP